MRTETTASTPNFVDYIRLYTLIMDNNPNVLQKFKLQGRWDVCQAVLKIFWRRFRPGEITYNLTKVNGVWQCPYRIIMHQMYNIMILRVIIYFATMTF